MFFPSLTLAFGHGQSKDTTMISTSFKVRHLSAPVVIAFKGSTRSRTCIITPYVCGLYRCAPSLTCFWVFSVAMEAWVCWGRCYLIATIPGVSILDPYTKSLALPVELVILLKTATYTIVDWSPWLFVVIYPHHPLLGGQFRPTLHIRRHHRQNSHLLRRRFPPPAPLTAS